MHYEPVCILKSLLLQYAFVVRNSTPCMCLGCPGCGIMGLWLCRLDSSHLSLVLKATSWGSSRHVYTCAPGRSPG